MTGNRGADGEKLGADGHQRGFHVGTAAQVTDPNLVWVWTLHPKKPLGSLYLMAHLEVHFSGTTNVVVEVATLDHGLHSGLWGGAVPDGLSAGGCERPFGVS